MTTTSKGHFYLSKREWEIFFGMYYLSIFIEELEKKMNKNNTYLPRFESIF